MIRKFISNFQFTPAVLALIAMNLIPLVGVFYFGWDAGTIVFLYWLENVVIGLLNLPKIMSAQGLSRGQARLREQSAHQRRAGLGGRLYLCVFFSFHYGLFCVGHYIFLQQTYTQLPGMGEMLAALTGGVIIWSLLGLTLSHIVSMFVNFYGKGEFKSRSPNTQMFVPYSRIVLLHIVIIVSGGFAMAAGQGVAPLVLLVALKIIFDLAAHLAEHSKVESIIAPDVS